MICIAPQTYLWGGCCATCKAFSFEKGDESGCKDSRSTCAADYESRGVKYGCFDENMSEDCCQTCKPQLEAIMSRYNRPSRDDKLDFSTCNELVKTYACSYVQKNGKTVAEECGNTCYRMVK